MRVFASKYQAYGNDFLVIGDDQFDAAQASLLTEAICDPHFGVGADGCIFLRIVPSGDFPLRIFNRDGSEAGMSGNGVRCAAAYLRHRKISAAAELSFATQSGQKIYRLVEGELPEWTFESDMGEPAFNADCIPFSGESPDSTVRQVPLLVGDRRVVISALSVGNPQCVVFCDELPAEDDFRSLGRALSLHPAFPEGSNVSFAVVRGKKPLEIRIWERGVGPTFSSGTGCCGAAVAAVAEGRVESPVTVQTETGTQQVAWSPGSPILLRGSVRFVADIHFEWSGQSRPR